ncbi:McrC family protein [Chitinophaga pinensis]|uniref:McrBC 5-methylcytosine restriction system component-like protein n=1 Tax=Chitinophaga pinensis (strain ATCC 43595 / DSM 2588 / LMG 13176 / NBRC 15968 / NCIMB 11800 / UQM 2034) TaxID=485918 RepID=A0A979GPZ3_CHIPD|nr:McrBC 5-methylcytosine restriction system component-like protein [Chitinophaga pinensis]ACU60937.1 McrBC 5-methylcytosine restriction system component-like protein [Chitinophaga pinensis DSM 2588]
MPLINRKKVVQVFEHQKLLFKDCDQFKQQHWKALAVYNEQYGGRYFTLMHNGIKFSNYVGVLQAGDLTIEILPKTDRERLDSSEEKGKWHGILLQMLQQCSLIKIDHVEKANLNLRSNSILDIYIRLFLEEVEVLLRRGLIKKYKRHTANLTTLKGKLDFGKHISANLIHKERFFVEHTIYSHENLFNQIINEVLKLIPLLVSNTSLNDKLGRIRLDFPELPAIKVTAATFDKIQYDRKSSTYQPALEIARLLLLNYRPDITGGTNNVIAILFDMNELWEEYIFRKLQRLNSEGIEVKRQQSQHFWKRNGALYPKSVRPDIVLRKGEKTIVLDTKWKLIPDYKPTDEDLKQMFVYNLYWECSHSVLLYPADRYHLETGAYFDFSRQTAAGNSCSVATCGILDDKHQLDKGIGERILKEILYYI